MSKKNGKKSPIGSRVAAVFTDGYYAPATVQSVNITECGKYNYSLKFDDGNHAECGERDMIGSNFGKLSDVKLKQFQKVYTTYNGREVAGYVQSYKKEEVLLSIPGDTEEKLLISRNPSEIRLLDRRRSQRLQQSSPMDYRKMAEEGSPCKGRQVSASIEVPKTNRIRKTSEEPTMTELMAAMVLSNLSCSPVFHNPAVNANKDSSPRSFGSSGVGSWSNEQQHPSPQHQPAHGKSSTQGYKYSPKLKPEPSSTTLEPSSPDDLIETDAAIILMERTTPTKAGKPDTSESEEMTDEPQDLSIHKFHMEHKTIKEEVEEHSPSPSHTPMEEEATKIPQTNHTVQAPVTIPLALHQGLPFPYYFPSTLIHPQYAGSVPIQITTTPPPRQQAFSPDLGGGSSAPGYMDTKLHRHLHRAAPYHKDDSSVPSPAGGSSPSTHTYGSAPSAYLPFPGSPIPVSSLSFSPTHRPRKVRSPLTSSSPAPPASSSHQPQTIATAPVAVPAFAILSDHAYQSPISAQPITIPGTKAFSWHNSGNTLYYHGSMSSQYTAKTPVIHHHTQIRQGSPKLPFPLSPKSVPLGRKVRGDGKKCRKVYGMENRDMWCTACRWKKACQRFPD